MSVSNGKWRPAPHLWAFDDVLLKTLADESMPRIIIVEAPPRHGKSEYWSKWVPSWYHGMYPDNRLILTSYESNFAKSWGRKVRDILVEHGEECFGIRLRRNNKSANDWTIAGHDGGMQTAGAGGALMGKGADCIVIDDAIKNSEQAMSPSQLDSLWDWWESTVTTRLEPNGIIAVVAQRFAERDLAGRLKEAKKAGHGEDFTLLSMPAIAEENDILGRPVGEALWPERHSRKKLERMREVKSAYWWNCQYQQRPTQHEGAEWPEEYFGPHLLTKYWPESFDVGVIFLDPSKGKTDRSDYSALVFLGVNNGKIWIDCDIKRRPASKMVADSFWFANSHQCDAFGIESNGFQELLGPEFDRQTEEMGVPPLPIHLIENMTNKKVRISRLGPYFQRRQFRIRDNEGGRLLVRQCKEHPIADHDDGPDAVESGLRLLRRLSNMAAQEEHERQEIANS